MRAPRIPLPLLLSALVLPPLTAGAGAGQRASPPPTLPDPGFRVERLAEGVYALIRTEPTGLWFEANNLLIVNDEDVVVVDANFSRAATRRVIEALRGITDRPVRYVVNTHWHDDHVTGNQEYRDAFPGVEFIAHASAPHDMSTVGAANRKGSLESGPGFAAHLRSRVEEGKSLVGAEITEEERAGYLGTVGLIERFVAEAPTTEVVAPTLTVDERLTLRRGDRTIEILHLGAGHTAADLVVHLPREGIVASGDLVVWPVPLVGSTSYPESYAGALRELLALGAGVLVPGHGPVQRDDAYVRTLSRLLTSVAGQTAAAVARGETLEQARESVDLRAFRDAIAGESRLRALLFQEYVVSPAVAAAFRQASERR